MDKIIKKLLLKDKLQDSDKVQNNQNALKQGYDKLQNDKLQNED